MFVFKHLVAAMTVTALSGAAVGQAPASAPAAAQTQKVTKVCRVASTGTLIPKRVCKTAAEWQQYDVQNGETLKEIRRVEDNKCAFAMGRC